MHIPGYKNVFKNPFYKKVFVLIDFLHQFTMATESIANADKPDTKEELISIRIVQLATDKGGTLSNDDLQVSPTMLVTLEYFIIA